MGACRAAFGWWTLVTGYRPVARMPFWRKLLVWMIILIAAIAFIVLFKEVLLPFVVGLAVAYFLDPAADWIERHKAPRWLAATLAIGLFALGVLVVIVLAFPLIQTQFAAAAEALPRYSQKIEAELASLLSYASQTLDPADMQRLRDAVGGQVGKAVQLFGALFRRVFDGGMALVTVSTFLFVTPIVAFYLLRDWDKLVGWIDALIPRDHAKTVRTQARLVDETLSGFVRGQATVCLVLGLTYGIALTLAGLQFGFVVGVLAGILAFIPYVGTIFGLFASVGLAVLQFDDPTRIGIVAGIFVLGQVLEGNVLTPKLVGERVGLHPVWVIFALFAGGAVLGFLGMLLALPVAAATGVLVRFAVAQYRLSPIFLGNDHDHDDDDPGGSASGQ
ncbi:MAG: AI-2E family transporter [Alphaproteobacteria bacterium]